MKLPSGNKFKGNLDPFVPPKQISDLQVAGVSRRQGTILLRWTAVGGNGVSSAHNVAKYKVTESAINAETVCYHTEEMSEAYVGARATRSVPFTNFSNCF